MIKELVFGTLLVGGGGYYLMSGESADVVRTINATPHASWRGFDAVLNRGSQGITDLSRGSAQADELSAPVVKSLDSKEIDLHIAKGGSEALRIHLRFEPLDGGKKTKLLLDADLDRRLLPEGSPLLAANGALFKMALGHIVDEMIASIEAGKPILPAATFSEVSRQMKADPRYAEMRRDEAQYERREAQRAAARPGLDPDEARLHPHGQTVQPMRPNPGP